MKVGVCTPSRGLIHSRTEEAIEVARQEAETLGMEFRRYYTHDRPIPDCFNEVVDQAYRAGCDPIWIVEEDVVPLPGAFTQSFLAVRSGADIAVVDFPMRSKGNAELVEKTFPGVMQDGAGRVTWCRTGCILLKRCVFDLLPRPWFSTCSRFVSENEIIWQSPNPTVYGCDTNFTNGCFQLGFQFAIIKPDAQHLELVEYGNHDLNNKGYHIIEPLPGPTDEYVHTNRRRQ